MSTRLRFILGWAWIFIFFGLNNSLWAQKYEFETEFKMDNNTMLLYHFNQKGGDTLDSSNNHYNGLLGAGDEYVPQGKFGGAISFKEGSYGVNFSQEAISGEKGTIEMWFYVEKFASCQNVLLDFNRTEQNGFFLVAARKNIILYYKKAKLGVPYIVVNKDLEAKRWYHLALTWNNESARINLFLDGEKIGEAGHKFEPNGEAQPQMGSLGNLYGGSPNDYTHYGMIDEFRISNIERYKPTGF